MKKRNMKMTSVVLAAALAAVSLAGCGGSGKTETTAAAGSADTTAAETGSEAESSEAAGGEAKEGGYKVAMISDTSVSDGGWGASCYQAMVDAAAEKGWETVYTDNVATSDYATVVRYNIRDFDYDMMQLETEAGQDLAGVSDRTAITILIAKLTAILRLANSMDKTHKSKLIDCRMAVREGQLVITTGYKGDLALESASFEQKAAFFEEIFGIRPVLKQKRRV